MTKDALEQVLQAREQRYILRNKIADQGVISVSLSLNIPGYPKTDSLISAFFGHVLDELKDYLLAHRVFLEANTAYEQKDEAGDFFISGIKNKDAVKIKNICEEFEESHALGRFIDVDVTDTKAMHVSSEKQKPCFFCKQKPAIQCRMENAHSTEELRNFLTERIKNFLSEKKKLSVCQKLASLALKSILYEISLSPKPGLVDKEGRGVHQDMDYHTFLDSTAAFSPYLYNLALLGFDFDEDDLSKALSDIRFIGLKMEKAMWDSTSRVNTQKGLIFLLGVSLFSAAYCIRRDLAFHQDRFESSLKNVCKDILKNELTDNEFWNDTHGEIVFKRFGQELGGGVRYEVERGLPTVFNFGLPYLKGEQFPENTDFNFNMLSALVAIMANNNDSNILYRGGKEALENIKHICADILRASSREMWHNNYIKLINYCKSSNLSPGGSADLLGVTLFIYFVEKDFHFN